MKKFLLSCLFSAVIISLYSQVPQGFNYQAIARDNSGNPIVNATLSVRLSILSDTTGFYASGAGTYVWEETHTNVKTNSFGMFTVVLGTGTKFQGSAATFSAISWTPGPYYVGTKIYYQSAWKIMGSAKLWTVPYAMVAAKADGLNSGAKVVSVNDASADALFEVKRKDGQTVFAVYPDAVNVFVPTGSKATKGGFAIGGFGEKAPSQDYFRVTPDSVRIYIDNTPSGKGSKGGFAIGGFDAAKGTLLKNYYMNVSGTSVMDTVKGSPQLLWFPNRNAFLAGNVWIGKADSVGVYSTALGYRSIAYGDYSQAFGYKAKALGNYSTSIGKNSIAGAGKTIAQNAFAMGDAAKATGSDSYAFGSGAEATGYRSFAFGSVSIDTAGNPLTTPTRASGYYSTAVGMGAQASNTGSLALGVATTSSGLASATLGYGSQATFDFATAVGFKARALQIYSTAIGYYSYVTGQYAHAFGYRAAAAGNYSLSLGYYANASKPYSTAMGFQAASSGDYSTAIGYQSSTPGNYSAAFGRNSIANGASSIAVGYGATTGASASEASAFGRSASATGTASLALGTSASASGATSVAMGYQASATNTYAVAIGYQAKATTTNAFSFGYNSEAAADNSFAIGTYGLNDDGTVNTTRPTKTTGTYSVAMGMGAQASQKGSMAFGVNSTASGQYSMALGYKPTSSGNYSTAIGYSASSVGAYATSLGYTASAPANYSVAIGMGSSTSDGGSQIGTYATAIGYNSRAWGNKSLAIGSQYSTTYMTRYCNKITGQCYWLPVTVNVYNTATGDYSIAVGNGNTASNGGMAIGFNNTARAMGSVALGHTNVADSAYSFAVGSNNTANGLNAFAFGESLIAQSANSFVIGTYNAASGSKNTWVNTNPLFVIGNGDSNTRNNAMVVQKSGAMYLYPDSATYGTYISTTNTTYGMYINNYAQLKVSGSVYGIGNSATQNNTSSTGNVYSQVNYGYNYGTGYNYGLLSYVYNYNASNTKNIYSGYFYGGSAAGASYYQGLYADKRSGASIDVAEYINDSYGNTEPADVVVADQSRKESVIKSTKPYQAGIIGVISTNPHLTMGMELVVDEKTGEEKKGVKAAKLALTGRVPVNVTGENGPIQPGDYLTSSSTPGCAMKWSLLDVNEAKDFEDLKRILAENEKRRGAILGKAVESFSGTGTGKIMVLISLQ